MKNKLIKAISSFLIMVLVIGSIEIYKADYVSATSIESKVSTSLKKNKYTYSGRAFKPTVTVKYAGKKLPKKNYTVKYPSGRKNIGKYTIIVKLKGKYKKKKLSGIKKISFTIVPQKPRFTAATGTNDVSVCINRYLIEMNKLTGYQIAYRKANASKTTKVKTKDYIKTIDGLKSNTRYAFKVRSYKTVKSKKYYSVWSDEVIVTTRKAKEGKEEKTTEKPKTTETKTEKTTEKTTESNTAKTWADVGYDVTKYDGLEWDDDYDYADQVNGFLFGSVNDVPYVHIRTVDHKTKEVPYSQGYVKLSNGKSLLWLNKELSDRVDENNNPVEYTYIKCRACDNVQVGNGNGIYYEGYCTLEEFETFPLVIDKLTIKYDSTSEPCDIKFDLTDTTKHIKWLHKHYMTNGELSGGLQCVTSFE